MSALQPHEVKRFWSKVDRAGDCWIWTGELNNHGYGRFATWTGGRRVRYLAHRLAFELTQGPLGALVARHTCDNPPCCNPEHLEVGTQADNLRDAVSRGRANLSGLHAYRRQRDEGAVAARAAGDPVMLARLRQLMGIGLTLEAAHQVARGNTRRLRKLREALEQLEDSA